MEEKWYQFWEKEGLFKADPNSKKPSYCLLMPPPNVTGALHLGHAMEHSIMDALARFKRMQGFDVLLLPGVDHAGIQFEGTLNKILEKEGTSKQKLGREEWLKRAWAFKDESYASVSATWRMMGLSADWDREVFTLDPKVQIAVLTEFQTFFDEDLLYKGAYIVQWCPKDQTAIEDVEMDYEERQEKLYFVKFRVIASNAKQSQDEYITVATTRPETISADPAIAIYPKHPKYGRFVGQIAINPFTKSEMQIIEDKRIDKDFGTGALKVTPGHSLLDYEIGKDHNLPILHAIDKTGRITDLDPKLQGLKATEARIKAGEILEELGAMEKVEDLVHSVPVCERCKSTIEPLISEEWFVKMAPLSEKALKRIDEVNFMPKNYLKILISWIKDVHDWCISRPLWWGYRIPVWYCSKCNPGHLVGKDKDMVISFEEPGKSCQRCSEKHWVQDEKLLDTWFSSGLWPMATLGWPTSAKAPAGKPDETSPFKRYFPWDFETSAGEIKYLWIARMIMLSLHFTNQIPFKNMFFHGMIRDIEGRKFSKSLGNGIDPNELREKWGTDATRMALYTYSAPGRDSRANKQIMDERAKNFRNFSTKLTNIARFIVDLNPNQIAASSSTPRNDEPTHIDDQNIMKKLDETITQVTKNLESYQLHLATEALYEFIWHQFADIYIESTKERRAEAQPTLEYVFKTSLELLHPFMPFITEELWQKLPHEGKSIMLTPWPASRGEPKPNAT